MEQCRFIIMTSLELGIEKYFLYYWRCARAQAEWLSEERARVTKNIKGLQNFGYQNKEGVFLDVEEILFLLETVRNIFHCKIIDDMT